MDIPELAGLSTDVPTAPVWPAAPEGYEGVWPPKPTGAVTDTKTVPFKMIYRVVSGNISDVVTGNFQLSSESLTIEGKAMVRREIYYPIIIVAFVLVRLLALVVYAIFRYGLLQLALIRVPWTDVTKIVLEPDKQQIGIAFNAPNYKGKIIPYSIAGKLQQLDYETFVAAANSFAPDRVGVGKLRGATSKGAWIVLAVVLIAVAAAIAVLSLAPSR